MPRYESPYSPSLMPKNLEHVLYEKKGHVAYVTINRPEVRNALNTKMGEELREIFVPLQFTPGDLRAIIITGSGDKAFCSGGDQTYKTLAGGYKDEDGIARLNVLDLQRQIRSLPIPVIAHSFSP